MNISNILLVGIICILLILLINTCFNNEFLTNDLPYNNDDSNLLIPTSDQVYNPHDSNRVGNQLSHQVTPIFNSNADTIGANTSIDIPIVYSKDELRDTSIKHTNSPSHKIIDTGSGNIDHHMEINNNALNNLQSIE